ncbi:DUF2339 domain-containing protein [Dyella sp.]|uniref:DUF2339 domain-containing protein n=1 Tax=Dyella sp. TaxID=1869338 RepID=UPI002ECFF607
MVVLWIVIGLIAGGLAGQSIFGALTGGFIGFLWGRQSSLSKQLRQMRGLVNELAKRPMPSPRDEAQAIVRHAAEVAQAQFSQAPPAAATPAAATRPPALPVQRPEIGPPALTTFDPANDWNRPPVARPPLPAQPPVPLGPSFVERLWQRGWGWLTEGNVPVKVGILVLFAGVAALLKYASDAGMFHLPVGLRLSGVALAAIGGLAFGWYQRDSKRVFALSLQGGAIGVLIIVTFAAFRLYSLIPSMAAFGILLVLVAGIGMLAVLQDALALAVLGLVAGFAAPILVSTGQGSHVALFSYYALLNVAILGIAWKRAWRVLNLLGFIATFGIGTAWGVLKYKSNLFASTEPFLVLNFLFYLVIPWLHVLRMPADRRVVIDGCLMFGNPLASLLLQGALLAWAPLPLAFSVLAGAAIYVVFAFMVRNHPAMRIVRETWAVIAVAFATLAVPLGLSANVTGSIFALEGAGLIWLGLRQQRKLARWSGLALQVLAGFTLLGSRARVDMYAVALPLLNKDFVGGMLVVIAGLASCRLYSRHDRDLVTHRMLAVALFGWSLLWWLGSWGAEIQLHVLHNAPWVAAWFVLLSLTAWMMAEVSRRQPRIELGLVLSYGAPSLLIGTVLLLLQMLLTHVQPFAGWMLAAVVISAVLGWRTLACLREFTYGAVYGQMVWLWRWCGIFMLAIVVGLDGARWLSGPWMLMLSCLPLMLLAGMLLWRPSWLASPLATTMSLWRPLMLYTTFALLCFLMLGALFSGGDAEPVRYVPLLNPTELTLLAITLLAVRWLADGSMPPLPRQQQAMLAGITVFVLVTDITLRGVHQWSGIGWGGELMGSSMAQLALTVVWSVFGLVAWVVGSRRGQRMLWLAGAVLMAVVLLKLLLIDRDHLGNLFGIGSFIAYGLLCTVIGYLAPAPPKSTAAPLSPKEEGTHAS